VDISNVKKASPVFHPGPISSVEKKNLPVNTGWHNHKKLRHITGSVKTFISSYLDVNE
jgi:hypothetical protein